jgi:hypothetical protein
MALRALERISLIKTNAGLTTSRKCKIIGNLNLNGLGEGVWGRG